MGNITSRQRGGVEEQDTHSSSAYRYPPKSGNFFGSHFIMGGEKFDSPQPESFLFGDNTDLNFLGSKPVPFPYPPPQANEPTKTLKSLVNIRRDSLHFKKLDTLGDGPKQYNIEFTFDCDVRVAITIYYLATEEVTPGGLLLTPRDKCLVSPTFQYRRGAEQLFSQPEYMFTPEPHEADLTFVPTSDILPVAIHCVAEEGEEPRQSHLTIAVVEKQSDEHYSLKAIKQKLFVDGLCYLLQEIYGIENKLADTTFLGDEDDVEDTGAECVVCMSDMRDTLILPCRHLCLCNACADSLRYQANNCPICRAPFRALLQIRALAKSGHSATHPALAAEAHTDGIPPGYELVNLVEALNGPLTLPPPSVSLATETQEQEAARSKKKNRRRGSRDQQQREKDRHERRVSASAPPPVEEPLPVITASPTPIVSLTKLNKRKESITIDIDNGESSSDQLDLVQEEIDMNLREEPAEKEEQEPEATTEDELLKDEKCATQTAEESSQEVKDECDEADSCSVSLRSSNKQIQSLPPTPRSTDSSALVRSSTAQSVESVNSTQHLLSSSSTPVTQIRRSSSKVTSEPAMV